MTIQANRSTRIRMGDSDYLYFGGTNYLGLAHRPEMLAAISSAFSTYGLSSGASRLTSGENDLLLSLEAELAKFAVAEASLVLPAGFMSNQAVVDGLDDTIDAWVVQDNAHISIQNALKQSRKPVIIDKDLGREEKLHKRLAISPDSKLGIFVEPIEPLTGTIFDVAHLTKQASSQDIVILDEAHSLGVLGKSGKGALEHFQLESAVNIIRTGTFSKSFGSYGGFVLATSEAIARIKKTSAGYRGSTSLPPPICAAAKEAIRLVQTDAAATIDKLKHNILLLNELLAASGVETLTANKVPIYYFRNTPQVARVLDLLPACNIYVPSMTSYFAGEGESSLRFTIQSGHTREDLQQLAAVFSKCLSVPERGE